MFLDSTKLFYSQVQNLKSIYKSLKLTTATRLPTAGLSKMQLQKSLEQYKKIPKSVIVQHIGERTGNFFEVRRIFAGILPNVPEKNSIKSEIRKESSSCYFGRRWAPFVPKFSGVCSDFQWFCKGLQRFCPDFHGFSRNQNFWGCAYTPCTPAPNTSDAT